jgi:hypothetical protein
MSMSVRSGEALRENSRTLGVIFQALSVLTMLATIYATMKVSSVGSQLGVGAIHDPLAWFIFLGGMFAALMLTGIGHSLGMLCAIFDRQLIQPRQSTTDVARATPTPALRRPQSETRTTVWEMAAEKGVDQIAAPKMTPDVVRPVAQPPMKQVPIARGGLWDWLTRERHFNSHENRRQ